MNRVFIVEPPRRDINMDVVREHGTVQYVFNRDDRRAGMFDTNRLAQDISSALDRAGFNADEDGFCLVGSLNIVCFALMVLLHKYGKVRVLMFSANTGGYIERLMDMREDYELRV